MGISIVRRDDSVAGRDGRDTSADREARELSEATRTSDDTPGTAAEIEKLAAIEKGNENFDRQVDQRLSMILHHEEVRVMAAIIKRVGRDYPKKHGSA
ncbi:MAG: hypothetical protein PHR28_07865 [candidate division Zixibacteria bacterium]|nr:hypothetical protein [candidate division Zixibacteria bacterium]